MRLPRHLTALFAIAVLAIAGLFTASAPVSADHVRAHGPHAKREWLKRYYDGACGRFTKYHFFYEGGRPDPFAYCYRPRGYYPYYNSHHWVPRHATSVRRAHFKHPKYYKAWGSKRRHYKHVQWHNKHHGGHDHAHW